MDNNIKKSKNYNIKNSNTLCIDSEYIKRKDKITSFFLSKEYKPMTRKEIAGILNIQRQDMYILENTLNELCDLGKLTFDDIRRYIVVNESNSYKCVFEYKNERFGFAICEDKSEEDIFIPDIGMNTAMNGDEILVVIDKSNKYNSNRRVGRIVSITKRKITKIVGSVYKVNKKIFVESIDTKEPSIYIDKILVDDKSIESASMVEVEITSYPNKITGFTGSIVRIICGKDEVNAYVKALYVAYELDKKETFNKEVMKEVENFTDEVKEEDLINRVDKTKDNIYTIDSEDAKDLDDAICVSKRIDGTYDLSVFIADVSHYVKDGTALDKEAISRATSIYVPGSVIPMLPKILSNGICSLTEDKIRLTLSVDMHIDTKGNVINNNIYKAYIKSKKKMTYEKVYKCIMKSDDKVLEEYKNYLGDIALMQEIADVLNKKRVELGSINFDIPETKVELDEKGLVKDIHPYATNISNKIIEEFMLITNMVVAEKFLFLTAPLIYRIHEKPDEEKLHNLNEVLASYGKQIKSLKNVTPKILADVLSQFDSEEEKRVISTITLRTLKLAKYSSECVGHFGLAFKYYCHFTSPIRRYPDLFIHRVISDYLENGYVLSDNKKGKYKKQSIAYSDISTDKEKESTRIERDFDDLYMAMFMKDKVGEEYESIISSVTSFGIFVKLESTVEGLVHISNMKGYFTFDEKKYLLVDNNNVTYKIGDKVKVRVTRVDIKSKQIDFELV
ncbi:MAG: ribonuclease R [Clostridia bacterium]|nr:ribonuclease R [Clostridia bacterium]MDD4386655.1 ribonuclease R [Clostridia bacterium]